MEKVIHRLHSLLPTQVIIVRKQHMQLKLQQGNTTLYLSTHDLLDAPAQQRTAVLVHSHC